MDGLAENESSGFDRPKVVKKKILCLYSPTLKVRGNKDKWTVEVFRTWQAACAQKLCILDPGSVFKVYYLHRVQSFEEKLEDMASLSLNYWLTKFVHEVGNKHNCKKCARNVY